MNTQRDIFLQDPIQFPGSHQQPAGHSATPVAPVFLGVGDKVKRISKQSDGSAYIDGEVLAVNGQYAKVRARRLYSPWHNCMREVWVKGSDCTVKYSTRLPRKKQA
jgi:hypothetical protein